MSNFPNNPFGDITKMLEQFKIPGVDMTAMIESGKKDIAAVVESNKKAMEGMQALAKKQTEMFANAMQEIQSAGKNLSVDAVNPAKHAELAKKAYEKALADMKVLAEIGGDHKACQ
jgi:phasin family protein